jgi:hypothetical protein
MVGMRAALLLSLLLVAGCALDGRDRWTAAPHTDPVVVILPVGLGPLAADAAEDAGQRSRWAAEVASRLNLRSGLPPTSSRWRAQWSDAAGGDAATGEPAPAITGSPDALALVRLTELTNAGASGWNAAAEMVVRDAAGRELWRTRATGSADAVQSAKMMSPDARPDRAAARSALRGCADELAGWCARQPGGGLPPAPATAPATAAPVADALIALDITSDPPGADVLVDGVFKGSTPCTLRLPAREATVRIELAGKIWERRLTPEPGLRIAPSLR